jgi:hypothetical protein
VEHPGDDTEIVASPRIRFKHLIALLSIKDCNAGGSIKFPGYVLSVCRKIYHGDSGSSGRDTASFSARESPLFVPNQ